ncbi:MAG: choice-of-anchor tandem repeat GloVer-containing protein [Rhizomicrobium sp.]
MMEYRRCLDSQKAEDILLKAERYSNFKRPQTKKAKVNGTETVIYKFCKYVDCPDGQRPNASPLIDSSGNLFGFNDAGVFELSRDAKKSDWDFSLLHTFTYNDGFGPQSSPIFDAAGDIYGTNRLGGTNGGSGTIFKLVPNGTSSQYTVLYAFCGCGDGMEPGGGVVIDSTGNLFGTTTVDNQGANGEIYEFNQTLQILHEFAFDGSDGRDPRGDLALDSAGNLFGTTSQGGSGQSGTIFELVHQ